MPFVISERIFSPAARAVFRVFKELLEVDEQGFGLLVEEEIHKWGIHVDEHEDTISDYGLGIYEWHHKYDQQPCIRMRQKQGILGGAYFRLQLQKAVFEAAMLLNSHQLLNIDCMALPVDVDRCLKSPDVGDVLQALRSFTDIEQCVNYSPSPHEIFYEKHTYWLVIMIIRGIRGEDLDVVVRLLADQGTLGRFDMEEYRKYWPESRK